MSHILIVGGGPAGLAAALRLAERGQRVTLAQAKPSIYNCAAGLVSIDLPRDTAAELRAMGARSMSGQEILHAFERQLLPHEAKGRIRRLPYHRLLRLCTHEGGVCCGGVLLNERTETLEGVAADAVLLATGGMHLLLSGSPHGNDGVAVTLAFQAGAAIRNVDRISTAGRFPVCVGGLVTGWDGETSVPGLYAAGECANGTALSFPLAQALDAGRAVADTLADELPAAPEQAAARAVADGVESLQQQIDVFRRTRGSRAPQAVERRLRESAQRTLGEERNEPLINRGLLDIRVMRQQAGRGGYDLGEGLYAALRLPTLLTLLELMLTTAEVRLTRYDGDLTTVLREGRIDVDDEGRV